MSLALLGHHEGNGNIIHVTFQSDLKEHFNKVSLRLNIDLTIHHTVQY